MKICKICKKELDDSLFRVHKSKPLKSGEIKNYSLSYCTNCEYNKNNEYNRKRQKDNPDVYNWRNRRDKVNAYKKRRFFYNRSTNFRNTYKALHLNIKEFALFLWHLWHKQKGLCGLTGRKLTRENAQIDHIIPRSKEGTNDFSNLRWVIKEANFMKKNHFDNELIEFAKDIIKTIGNKRII